VIERLPLAVGTLQLALFLATCNSSGTEAVHCLVGETQECFCPDGAMGIQECLPDNSGWNCCVCPSPCDDDDDIVGPHDDDDTFPPYTGGMDMESSPFEGWCNIDVPLKHMYPEQIPEGYYQFDLILWGWANFCWVEFWEIGSDYCEGFDSHGDPCESYGYVRPGWHMTNETYGWDPVYGHWDYWYLDLDYVMDLEQADIEGASIVPCEWWGYMFQTFWCCEEVYTGDTTCMEYWPMVLEDYAAGSCVKGTAGSRE